jgi:3-hydroxyisobutyrate dehydrogenase
MNSMHIGWIGTGVMGNAMCGHLIDAGHQVHLYNRTRTKAANLIARGARWCDTPREVAQQSEWSFPLWGTP